MKRIKYAVVATLLALGFLVFQASPASADGASSNCASWGCASWDLDIVAGGTYLSWSVDDVGQPDGYCVYMYARRIGGNWGRLASSCGPASGGSTVSSATNWDPQVLVTRGPIPGANYFTLWNNPA